MHINTKNKPYKIMGCCIYGWLAAPSSDNDKLGLSHSLTDS